MNIAQIMINEIQSKVNEKRINDIKRISKFIKNEELIKKIQERYETYTNRIVSNIEKEKDIIIDLGKDLKGKFLIPKKINEIIKSIDFIVLSNDLKEEIEKVVPKHYHKKIFKILK